MKNLNLTLRASLFYTILGIATLAQIMTPAAQAHASQTPIEETQAKISDAAKSAADTASKLANSAQAAFSLGIKKGKAESILFFNKHLNGYDIDVHVEDSTATLTGTVSESIEKDLAKQLTLSVTGIDRVINKIKVQKNTQKNTMGDTTYQLTATLKDASITARIKASLLANENISGMDINVNTKQQQVTLLGVANSNIQKDLIEQIARNTAGVHKVINKIEVNRMFNE